MYIKIDGDIIIIDSIREQSIELFEKSFGKKLEHLEAVLSLLIHLKSSVGYKKIFFQRLQSKKKFPFIKKHKLQRIKDNVDTYYRYAESGNLTSQRLKPYEKLLSVNLPNISLPDLTREELKFYNLLVAFQGINDISLFNTDYLSALIRQINLRTNTLKAVAELKKAKEIEKKIKLLEKDISNYISSHKTINAETIILKYIKLLENKIEFELKRIKIEKIIHYDSRMALSSNLFFLFLAFAISGGIYYLLNKPEILNLKKITDSHIFISSLLGTTLWYITYFGKYIISKFRQNIKMVFKLLEGLITAFVIVLFLSGKTNSRWFLLLAFSAGFSSSAAILTIKVLMKHLFIGFNSFIVKKSKGKYNYEDAIKYIFEYIT